MRLFARATSAALVAAAPRHIACVGDSITLGQNAVGSYPARLFNSLPDAPVIANLGVDAATVASYEGTTQHATLLSRAWDVVVIMFGTNEVISHPGQIGNACAENLACTYATHYGKLVDDIRAVSPNTTILAAIPPQTYGAFAEVDVLRKLIPAIALAHKLPLPIDLYAALYGTPLTPHCTLATSTPSGCRFFCDAHQCDQLHPSAAGYQAIAAAVALRVPPTMLCLHGGGQTIDDMEDMLRKTLGSLYNSYHLVYVLAPHNYLWLRDPPNGKDAPTLTAAWDKLALETLDKAVQAHGPVYGIVGYSQGAAMALAYLAHAPSGTFQIALMYCGYVPTTHQGVAARIKSKSPISVRALVYAGLEDKVIDACLTMDYAKHFASVTYAIDPDGGHVPPAAKTAAGMNIAKFLDSDKAAPAPYPPPVCNAASVAQPAHAMTALMAVATWALQKARA